MVLIYISLMISNAELLFMYLLITCKSTLEKHLLRCPDQILIGLFVFLLLICVSSLYMLDIKPLSDV